MPFTSPLGRRFVDMEKVSAFSYQQGVKALRVEIFCQKNTTRALTPTTHENGDRAKHIGAMPLSAFESVSPRQSERHQPC